MKTFLFILAVLAVIGTRTLQAQSTELGSGNRYQLLLTHADFGMGTAETILRIDTYTGQVCYLVHGRYPIPADKQKGLMPPSKEISCYGWVAIEDSLQQAFEGAKKMIDSFPSKAP